MNLEIQKHISDGNIKLVHQKSGEEAFVEETKILRKQGRDGLINLDENSPIQIEKDVSPEDADLVSKNRIIEPSSLTHHSLCSTSLTQRSSNSPSWRPKLSAATLSAKASPSRWPEETLFSVEQQTKRAKCIVNS